MSVVYYEKFETDHYIMEVYQEKGERPQADVYPKGDELYLHEIITKYPFDKFPEFKDLTLEIDTVAYGTMHMEQFDRFMKAQNAGREALTQFQLRLNTLTPVYKEPEEYAVYYK